MPTSLNKNATHYKFTNIFNLQLLTERESGLAFSVDLFEVLAELYINMPGGSLRSGERQCRFDVVFGRCSPRVPSGERARFPFPVTHSYHTAKDKERKRRE